MSEDGIFLLEHSLEFAKFVLDSQELRKVKGYFNFDSYLLSSFIDNGEFDERLIKTAEKLIDLNVEVLKPILAWICIVNRFEDLWQKLNYNEKSYKLSVTKSKDKYSEGDLNIDIFNQKPTKRIMRKIYNYDDRYIDISTVYTYKINNIEKYILKNSNLEIVGDHNSDYSERDFYLKIVNKYTPFLLFGNYGYDLKYIEDYAKINPLYRHVFIYTYILTRQIFHKEFDKYITEDYVEYNLFTACLVAGSYYNLENLYRDYEKKKKCYKLIDYENRKYL